MKTTKLVEQHRVWLKENWILFERTPFTSKALLELETLRYKKEKEIIKSIFDDIPAMTEFTIERNWGRLNLVSINKNVRPIQNYEDLDDELRSWFIEIGLKKIEVDFLIKSLDGLSSLWEGSANERKFSREEFLK